MESDIFRWRLKRKPLLCSSGISSALTPLRQVNHENVAPEGRWTSVKKKDYSESELAFQRALKRRQSYADFSAIKASLCTVGNNVSPAPSANAGSGYCSTGKPNKPTGIFRLLQRSMNPSTLQAIEARQRTRRSWRIQQKENNRNGESDAAASLSDLVMSKRKDKPEYSGVPDRRRQRCNVFDKASLSPEKSHIREEEAGTSVGCCRALQFERNNDSQGDDVPLEMMDLTAMISKDSLFKLQVQHQGQLLQQQQPLRSQRKVRFAKRCSQRRSYIGDEKRATTNITEDQFDKDEVEVKQSRIPKSSFKSGIPLPQTEIKATSSKTSACKVPNKSIVGRRRSAIPCGKLTPKYSIGRNLRSYSTSKVSVAKTPARGSTLKYQKSKLSSRKSTGAMTNIPEIKVEDFDKNVKTQKHCDASIQTDTLEKCDASTSMELKFVCGDGLCPDLMKKVEELNSEISDIQRKFNAINEQTLARRKGMKESGLLEKYSVSISPLKRMYAMLHETETSREASAPKTHEDQQFQRANAGESDMDITDPHDSSDNDDHQELSINTSCMDQNVSSTCDANTSKWQHLKLNSRAFKATSSHKKNVVSQPSTSPMEEYFTGNVNNISPFTEMAGDCERPSLAPMTPHSHKQVSLIKFNIRKQLDQLYK